MRSRIIYGFKNLLAKIDFMYYYFTQKEFRAYNLICRTLLVFFLLFIAFQSPVLADIKENLAEDYHLKGFEAQENGNLGEALSFYVKAVSISSSPAVIYNDIGVIYEKLGMPQKAKASYLEAIKLDNQHLAAYSNIASLYEREGNLSAAAEYLKKRVRWGELNDPWTINAKSKLRKLAERDPKLKKWLRLQGRKEAKERRMAKASGSFYREVIQAKELYEKGQKLVKKERYRQAIIEYNRALSLTPKNPKIINARNIALIKLTQEKVRQHADIALRWLELGDTVSAKIEFRKALAIIPNEPIQISK